MKNLYTYLSFIFCFIMLNGLTAQEKSLSIRSAQDTIYLGNSLYLTLSIQNIKGNFTFPEIDSCLIQQPAQRSNIQITNGKRNSSVEYDYVLTPLRVGKYTIPSLSITESKEMEFSTDTLQFIVIPHPDRPEEQSIGDKKEPDKKQERESENKEKNLPPNTKIIRI